jgi:hypothetical protein
MVAEHPIRVHGELLIGFDLSEATVSRWVRREPKSPNPARLADLPAEPREAIAAMDFFTVPKSRFRKVESALASKNGHLW